MVAVCTLSKRGEQFGKFIDRHCVFTREHIHLFEFKDRTGYRGSYRLEFMKTQFFMDEVAQNRFGVRFIKNSICEELFTKD